jgi:hypothetical protein
MKRFQLTVTYTERNPEYVDPPTPDYQFGTERDRREPNQREPLLVNTALSCELTPEQWEQLKRDTLNAWNPKQDGGAK